MDPKETADLFISATDKIQFYWNFYVVMLVALIGWLVSINKPLSISLKALITVGYVVFVLMNITALYSSYTFAEAIRLDLLAIQSELSSLPNTYAVLAEHSYAEQRTAMFAIHGVLGLTVGLAVWVGHFGEQERKSS